MLKIIYASVTGNTESVARYVYKKMQELYTIDDIEIVSADEVDVSIFNKEDIFIVATSTWNLGQMNQYLEGLYAQIEDSDLSEVKMAFIGLGDKVYGEEYFCRSMKDFRERAVEKGAKELVDALIIDGDPEPVSEKGVDEWVDDLKSKLPK